MSLFLNKITLLIGAAALLSVSTTMSQVYTSADFPHPSFGITEIESEELTEIKESTQFEKDLAETELVNLIEENSMAFWVSCPNCEGGFQGGLLRWKAEEANKVYCHYCGLTYPNEKYPENRVQEIHNGTGDIQKLSYYEDERDKQRYYFSAKVRNARFIRLLEVVYNFARIYAATGEIPYARRAALLLNRMAVVYPKLLPHAGLPNDGGPSRFTDLSLPHEYYSGKIWDWWYAEIPWQCAEAYDLIYSSGELEKLSKELGVDVKERIENDLLRKSVEFVLEFSSILSNAEINTMTSMVAVGRAIGEPSYVHEAIQRAKELLQWHFFRDGIWMEFSTYHFDVVEQYLSLMRSVRGYSDPSGYMDPIYGTHFNKFDPDQEFPQLKLAQSSIYAIFQPDGFMPSTGDTKYNDRNWFSPPGKEISPFSGSGMTGPGLNEFLPPLMNSISGILPGTDYAWLGMGSGTNQMQVGLNFCESAGHVHYDGLNLSIFAFGHQLLPDLGYTHTKMRWWSWGTMAHNTVLVMD